MAGKYGPGDVTITLEDGPGGTARNLQNFTLSGISIKDNVTMVETTALGDTWREHTPTGLYNTEPISLEVIWDTTGTTGTHVILGSVDNGPQDDGRQLVVVFGNSKTYTVDVRLQSYEVVAAVGELTKANVELLPTGAGAWS